MQHVSIPWAMWYETEPFDLALPDSWDVTVANMAGGPDIGDEGIRRALAEPIGAPRLRELARGRRDACILVDDISRPTPAYRILPTILEELYAGGLDDDDIIVICAAGTHRPFQRQDWVKKIGAELTDRLDIRYHNPTGNLEFMGMSSQGFPLWINRDFVRADLKIGAGMIMPRGHGYGGGSKIVLPGVSGRETVYFNHMFCPPDVFTTHLQEVGQICGLEYIVNPLLSQDLGIMAMVAGEPLAAFAEGVALAEKLYATEVPTGIDIALCNAWPKDTDAHQVSLARVPLFGAAPDVINPGGTVVTLSACPEGSGFHLVMGPGTRFRTRHGRNVGAALTGSGAKEVAAQQILFAPGVNGREVDLLYGDTYMHCRRWQDVVDELLRRHGDTAKVVVFPAGAMQEAAKG